MTNPIVSEYLRQIGSKGGSSGTGKAKARKVTSEQARKAALARWRKYRLRKRQTK